MDNKKTAARKQQAFYVFSHEQLYAKRFISHPGLSFTTLIFTMILTVFSLALVVYFLAKVGKYFRQTYTFN